MVLLSADQKPTVTSPSNELPNLRNGLPRSATLRRYTRLFDIPYFSRSSGAENAIIFASGEKLSRPSPTSAFVVNRSIVPVPVSSRNQSEYRFSCVIPLL